MTKKAILNLPWRLSECSGSTEKWSWIGGQVLKKGSKLRAAKRGCGLVVSVPKKLLPKGSCPSNVHVTTGDPLLDSLVLQNVKAMDALSRQSRGSDCIEIAARLEPANTSANRPPITSLQIVSRRFASR